MRRLSLLGVAAVGAGAALAGCGGGTEETQTAQTTPPPTSKPPAADPCSDTSGISETDLKMRETLKYVAQSPDPAKLCDNCKFWTPPPAGKQCGGCQLIKGPINPKGHCTSWFARETG